MRPFAFEAPADANAAIGAATSHGAAAQYIAGGTTLVDLMKLDVMRPAALVDINGLDGKFGSISVDRNELRLGALARMNEAGDHPDIVALYPAVAQSLQLAASQQIRNMATLGGNVLQRTRCDYFRDVRWAACNKREPGSGCAAIGGVNRKHAVLGGNERCIAAYPGDFAQALIALGAKVETLGPRGVRSFAFETLHLNSDDPHVETILQPGEIITGFVVPGGSQARRSVYVKVRDRQSYEFAAASAAVALDLRDGVVQNAGIGLGGLAYRPWRAHAAEQALQGKRIDEQTAEAAAQAAFAEARPPSGAFNKVEIGRKTLVRALLAAARMEI